MSFFRCYYSPIPLPRFDRVSTGSTCQLSAVPSLAGKGDESGEMGDLRRFAPQIPHFALISPPLGRGRGGLSSYKISIFQSRQIVLELR